MIPDDRDQRPPLMVGSATLQQVFNRQPTRCASVEEYARAAGHSPDEVLDLLAPLLAQGIVGLDSVDGSLLVNTAPAGRPAPAGLPQARANLWELLLDRAPAERAVGLWRLVRGLEAGGWRVEMDRGAVEARALVPTHLIPFAVWVRGTLVPLVPYPGQHELPPVLDVFDGSHSHGVAVTCANRELDATVTAARSWFLSRPNAAGLTVFVLEAPSFSATVLRPDDNSVTPVVVQRYEPTPTDAGAPDASVTGPPAGA